MLSSRTLESFLYLCAMNREEHIAAFVKLGTFINAWLLGDIAICDSIAGSRAYSDFTAATIEAVNDNEWFTTEGVKEAMAAISSQMLAQEKLEKWLQEYSYTDYIDSVKPVGIIAAGNIPLVCFHDILCVLLSGYALQLKPSSKDKVLVSKVVELLIRIEPKLADRVVLTNTINPADISGLIATGSNNTARYIEHEFSSIPILSRRNRTSIAILTGGETKEELQRLSNDIFSYFGMGCRNVSKLYIPKGYDFSILVSALSTWRDRMNKHQKYTNSYKHERAISLSLGEKVVDGEFFMLKMSEQFSSPLAVVYCEEFNNFDELKNHIVQYADALQCVVSAEVGIGNVRFGQTQTPALTDYADGVDTIQWLIKNIE